MKATSLLVAALIASTPALAYDPNTADSIVIIEQDEIGFLLFGTLKPRQIGPGWHNKLPFIERVGVITPAPIRNDYVSVSIPLPGGELCEINAEVEYNIANARKAFDWRKANGLDTSQQRSIFKEPRTDYTEPSRVLSATLTEKIAPMSHRQAACGAIEAWLSTDALTPPETINADGTQILDIYQVYTCASDLRAAMAAAEQSCRLSPPLSKSFSSSVRDSPHRNSPRQNQR